MADITLEPYGFTASIDSVREGRGRGTKHSQVSVAGRQRDILEEYEMFLSGPDADLFDLEADSEGYVFLTTTEVFDYDREDVQKTYTFDITAERDGEEYVLPHEIHLQPENDNTAAAEDIKVSFHIDSTAVITIGDDVPVTDPDLPSEKNIWEIHDVISVPDEENTEYFAIEDEHTVIFEPHPEAEAGILDSLVYQIRDMAEYSSRTNVNQRTYKVYYHIRKSEYPSFSAENDTFFVRQGHFADTLSQGEGSVLYNDTYEEHDEDAETPSLRAVLVEPPRHGEVDLLQNGNFEYRHDGTGHFVDSFAYEASNGEMKDTAEVYALVRGKPVLEIQTIHSSRIGRNAVQTLTAPLNPAYGGRSFESMVVVNCLSPAALNTQYESLQLDVRILDAVGNVVASSDEYGYAGSGLYISEYDAENQRFILLWDGRNTAGRSTGPGTYAVVVTLKYDDRETSIRTVLGIEK
ncbi:MAG: hypothetical protein ACQEQ4_09250 [Fibrobacterota bacterium]